MARGVTEARKGGGDGSYHSRKDCLYLSQRKEEHESERNNSWEAGVGHGRVQGCLIHSPSMSLAFRAGRTGREKRGERIGVADKGMQP